MFSHIMLGTSNFDAAKDFYDKVLATLGAGPGNINVAATGHRRAFWMHNGGMFSISEPGSMISPRPHRTDRPSALPATALTR